MIQRDGYLLILDAQAVSVLEERGGLELDYVDEANQKGYLLKMAKDAGDGCGSGGCSC